MAIKKWVIRVIQNRLQWAQEYRRQITRGLVAGVLVLAMGLMGCGSDRPQQGRPAKLLSASSKRFIEDIVEVAPPDAIQELRKELEVYQPQVHILSPQPGEILETTQVSVQFDVKDLPLFQDEEYGLGPHLHVILDNQPYIAVYDATQPLVFDDLEPGTHTIRAFASRPWHESFKNAGAYDQVTFSVFTETPENNPAADQPVITYSRPKGVYGAEPIMLDFYLANAPLHFLAQEDVTDTLEDWQIRCTVNGQSFTFNSWEPIYLTGFTPGTNWIKLELIDTNGNLIDSPFNGTARIIEYQPDGQDTLSKLIRGEWVTKDIRRIVDPNYVPEPEPVEPELTEPEVTEPDLAEPEVSKPEEMPVEILEPESTELDIVEPELTEPEAPEAESSEPEVTTPKSTASESSEPQPALPKSTSPESTQPGQGSRLIPEPSAKSEKSGQLELGGKSTVPTEQPAIAPPSSNSKRDADTASPDVDVPSPPSNTPSNPDVPTDENEAPSSTQVPVIKETSAPAVTKSAPDVSVNLDAASISTGSIHEDASRGDKPSARHTDDQESAIAPSRNEAPTNRPPIRPYEVLLI